MVPLGSIFLDFRLPNATSWYYVALVLAIALFFKFNRVFLLRNWDLLCLFLLVPALLYLREAQETKRQMASDPPGVVAATTQRAMALSALASLGGAPPAASIANAVQSEAAASQTLAYLRLRTQHGVWLAYLWLLGVSAYYLLRSLADLGVVRKPIFLPNLNVAGLAWLGATLLVVMAVRALLPALEPVPEASTTSVMLEKAANVATQAAVTVNQTVAPRRMPSVQWIAAGIAIACHVVVVVGLVWIGCRHFQNSAAGMAGAVLYLLLPYSAFHVKDLLHVFPAALMTAIVALYRWPIVVGVILGLGAGTVYFPVLLVPLWLGFYRQRGAGRFLAAFLIVAGSFLAYLWLDDTLRPYIEGAMSIPDWRAWDLAAQPTAEGFWSAGLHHAYRVPFFIGYVALVIASALWPSPKNLGHVIALSAALVLGIQFWYADAGGIYVLWYAPLLIMIFIRPNLSQRFAPPLTPDVDWIKRGLSWPWRRRTGAVTPVPATVSRS